MRDTGTTLNNYEQELGQLEATYKLALSADVASLCTAIAGASESSIIGVGSGGSYTVASLLCNLHEIFTGRVSRSSTPLEIICNPNLASASPVFLISAEGKNPDIVEVLLRARYQSARAIHILTNRRDSPLMQHVASLSDISPHIFELVQKDGYLATNSLLLNSLLVARAYGELDRGDPLSSDLRDLKIDGVAPEVWVANAADFIGEAIARRQIIITYSPLLRPVAYDLESKLSEAALLYCQLADLRSFAHGRHLWLSERPKDCTILALIEPSMEQLWVAMKALFPADVPVQTLRLGGTRPQDLITGLVAQMYLVAGIARAQNRDVGQPAVQSFGKDMHYMQLDQIIARPDRPNDYGERTKFEVLGARWPSIVNRGPMRRALDAYRDTIRKQKFRAVIFDYDGTLCPSVRRHLPPPDRINQQLLRLINSGVTVAIASGRGGSVREDLQKCLPTDLWAKVKLGLYNSGWIGGLDSDYNPSPGSSEFLSHVTRIVNGLRDIGVPIEEVKPTHPYQVSVRFREGVSTEQMWFVFGDALRSAGLDLSRMVRSKHSIDILAHNVAKTRLIADIIQKNNFGPYEVLTIGDQGAWPGNDYSLLEHRYSLSVDFPSRRLDRGWKFAPDHKRNVDATVWYLERLSISEGCFSVQFEDTLPQIAENEQ